MNVKVNVEEAPFGKGVTEAQVEIVAQDIIDRYCNTAHYNREELEDISNNRFSGCNPCQG